MKSRHLMYSPSNRPRRHRTHHLQQQVAAAEQIMGEDTTRIIKIKKYYA